MITAIIDGWCIILLPHTAYDHCLENCCLSYNLSDLALAILVSPKFICSQRAVTTALWCNLLVFSLKFGVWLGTSSHVMLAEVVHSVADFANQVILFMILHKAASRCTICFLSCFKFTRFIYYAIQRPQKLIHINIVGASSLWSE